MPNETPHQDPQPYPFHQPAPWAAPPGYAMAPPPTRPKTTRRKKAMISVGGAALAAALVVSGVGIGEAVSGTTGTIAQGATSGGSSSAGSGTSSGSGTGSGTSGSAGTSSGGSAGTAQGSNSAQNTSSSTAATATQQSGIVTIVSVLKYENAESAGTGMILTSNGEILTNNHVVNGATSITVTDETTGRSYRADVVGTDPTDDVAVLQLRNASGLTTATLGDSSDVAVGDAVTGVGNGGGTGELTAAAGTVTALNQSITATDESGSDAENLTGLIETNAGIVAGDSGGPLYDSAGEIVGIDTAGSTSAGAAQAAQTTAQTATQAYAIPIDSALKIADQIESGVETSTIHIGLPAFLGVGVADTTTGGVGITSVLSGGAADDAGITAGSVITAIGGKTIGSAARLQTVLAGYQPGQRVTVTWTDTAGASHTATVTLASGPAD